MAACRLLYGVTMAVRGVSHVVSVELAHVDEILPQKRAAGLEGAVELARMSSGNGSGADEEPRDELVAVDS